MDSRAPGPGWDGRVFPLVGVGRPDGTVLSVPPPCLDTIRQRVRAAAGALTPHRLEVLRHHEL